VHVGDVVAVEEGAEPRARATNARLEVSIQRLRSKE
jgi:hypothetical protein